jgi:hypothetical protein
MNKFTIPVFAILFSFACPASLSAAVTEEYKSVQDISDEQSPAQSEDLLEEVEVTEAAPTASAAPVAALPVQETVNVRSRKVVYNDSVALASDTSLRASYAQPASSSKSFGITPMVGGAIYAGDWGRNTRNQIGLGLALELPVSSFFAFELEAGYNTYKVAYTPSNGVTGGNGQWFDYRTFLIGGNGKIYLTHTKLRPFVGAGLMGMMYDNMYGVTSNGNLGYYNTIIGSANLMFGLDLAVSETVSFGARASYLIPVINKPFTANTVDRMAGLTSSPGFEQAALINNNLWRIMGTMTIRM